MFLTRTSCRKTTHANGYDGVWPGWAVSVSVLPLTDARDRQPGGFWEEAQPAGVWWNHREVKALECRGEGQVSGGEWQVWPYLQSPVRSLMSLLNVIRLKSTELNGLGQAEANRFRDMDRRVKCFACTDKEQRAGTAPWPGGLPVIHSCI